MLSQFLITFWEAFLMIRVEQNIVIQAPVDQVFNYAADYQKWSE